MGICIYYSDLQRCNLLSDWSSSVALLIALQIQFGPESDPSFQQISCGLHCAEFQL